MRTYKLTIAYDGTGYQGWQRQASTENTIQGILERCISEKAGYAVEVTAPAVQTGAFTRERQTASVVLRGPGGGWVFPEAGERDPASGYQDPGGGACEKRIPRDERARWGKCMSIILIPGNGPDVFTRRYCFHYPRKL